MYYHAKNSSSVNFPYLTRIFAGSSGTHHVVEDFVFSSIKRLTFGVGHQLDRHLLQDCRLKSP
jgi:hypothetical protein